MIYVILVNDSSDMNHSLKFTVLITYIHNWPLQPFSQDYGLASHSLDYLVYFIKIETPTASRASTLFFIEYFTHNHYFIHVMLSYEIRNRNHTCC